MFRLFDDQNHEVYLGVHKGDEHTQGKVLLALQVHSSFRQRRLLVDTVLHMSKADCRRLVEQLILAMLDPIEPSERNQQ